MSMRRQGRRDKKKDIPVEEVGDKFLNLGNSGRSTDQDDLINA